MMLLRVKKGKEEGKTYSLEQESAVLGRDTVADVTLMDEAASRKHAEVFMIGEMYFVKDLGSRNGTFVNEEQVEEELLRVGDRIRIGSTVLVFEDESSGPPVEEVEFRDDRHIDTTGLIKLEDLGLDTRTPAARFETLYEMAKALSSEREVSSLLKKVADEVHKAVSAGETYVFVKVGNELRPMAVKKTKKGESVSRSIITSVMQTRRSVLTSDATADSRFKGAESIVMKGIQSVMCAPLLAMDEVKGVIYAAKSSMTDRFSDDDLEMVSAAAMMAGVAIEGIEVREKQKNVLLGVVRTLVAATELRDPSIRGHSERVAGYCAATAVEMKFAADRAERVHLAGLLHDIGKVAVSEHSLHSVGQEVAGVKGGKEAQHVILGEKILINISGFDDIAEGVKTHHETFSGSGFPEGLAGEDIPIMGRIIGVANGLDHLLSRGGEQGDGMKPKEALMQIGKLSGQRHDPEVVKALLIAHRNDTLFSREKNTADLP